MASTKAAAAIPRKRGRPRSPNTPPGDGAPGRVPPGMVRTPFLIPRTLQNRVNGLAKLKGLNVSLVVIEALEKYTQAELVRVINAA